MKIGEKVHHEDGGKTLVVESIYDNAPVLKQVEQLRSAGIGQTGDYRHVGRIPMHLLSQWLKEAGVSWGSKEAKDVIKRKMLSGDFDKLRNWQGTYRCLFARSEINTQSAVVKRCMTAKRKQIVHTRLTWRKSIAKAVRSDD